jgi:predicted HD phosphohydrolase
VNPTNLTVDDIGQLLASGAAGEPVEAGASFTHLDHALQTATLLRAEVAERGQGEDEDEGQDDDGDALIVAGLVHDIGHLLPGVGDAEHGAAGAAAVRGALGKRVAGLVGLHVAAKRYLVASGGTYGGGLSAGSVTSLSLQGGPMSSDERARFEALPLFGDAVALRRADDRGKVEGLVVDGLAAWMEVVRRVALRVT